MPTETHHVPVGPPAPPDRIRVGPMDFTVELVRPDDLRDPEEPWLGRCDGHRGRIVLLDGQAIGSERIALLHECLHAIEFVADAVRTADPTNLEEDIFHGLDGPLLGLLRDNPRLVAYLTAPPEGER